MAVAAVVIWLFAAPRLQHRVRRAVFAGTVAAVLTTVGTWLAIPSAAASTGSALAFQPLPPGRHATRKDHPRRADG